ncbi:unnamed protein product, partial [Laminaria digitata]
KVAGQPQTFASHEVIICAGALQSPVILQRAGIGAADNLKEAGITVMADRAGVGANLQNHAVVYVVAQLRRDAAQPVALKSHSIATMRYSSGVPGCGELDMSMSISSKTGWHALGRRIAALVPTILKPASRGSVILNADGTPSIAFNYLSDDRDRQCLVGGVQKVIDMLLSPEVRPLWH